MTDFAADVCTDQATLRARTQTGTNGLGEPTFANVDTALTGLLVRRAKQVWTELGLVAGTEAVFLTTQPLTEIPAGAVLIAGGTTYRRVTVARRSDLWGDDGVTRLILQEGA
jgi:hypothetical protein